MKENQNSKRCHCHNKKEKNNKFLFFKCPLLFHAHQSRLFFQIFTSDMVLQCPMVILTLRIRTQ